MRRLHLARAAAYTGRDLIREGRMLVRILLALALLIAPGPVLARGFASDRITVTAVGKGPDVVLVPGLTSSPAAWKHVATDVPGYRYHLVQVKGFAGVPADGNAKGDLVKASAEEIARYITVNKLRKPAVVGHSMGGTVTMMVAARHPTLIGRAMVVDQVPWMGIFFGPPGTTADSIKPTAAAIRKGMAAATPAEWKTRIAASTANMVATESERAGVAESGTTSDQAASAQAFEELLLTDLRPELAKVTVPTTVLYVTPRGVPLTDAMVDAVYQASYAGLTGVKLVRIPDSAHFIMYDNRPRFAAELKSFLSAR